jgi:hypothetical protein
MGNSHLSIQYDDRKFTAKWTETIKGRWPHAESFDLWEDFDHESLYRGGLELSIALNDDERVEIFEQLLPYRDGRETEKMFWHWYKEITDAANEREGYVDDNEDEDEAA